MPVPSCRSIPLPIATVSLLLSVVACGDPCEEAASMTPDFQIGTGEESFTALEAGGTLTPDYGPQGGRHVWMAVETQGINTGNPKYPTVIQAMFTAADNDEVSFGEGAYYGRLNGTFADATATGIQVYVSDYDLLGNPVPNEVFPVTVSVRVEDTCGTSLFEQMLADLDLR